jgi:hypothetical protein
MTIIKRSGKNVEQRDPMNTAGRNEDWYSNYGKKNGGSSEN